MHRKMLSYGTSYIIHLCQRPGNTFSMIKGGYMVNKVFLIGRLGSDPKVLNLPSGNQICTVNLAVTEKYRKNGGELKKTTEWIPLVLWGQLIKNFVDLTSKGTLIYIEGKWHNSEWKDQNNQKRTVSEVYVSKFELIEKKQNCNNDNLPSRSSQNDDLPF